MRVAAVCAIAALVGALYGRALELWWTWDDAYLIHLAMAHPLRDYFTAEFWRSQPNQHLSPLYQLAVEAGLQLTTNAAVLYSMHLAAMLACAASCYLVLRLWLSQRIALIGVGLFLIGTPLSELATRLSTTNYFHALTLAAAAVFVHVIGLRRHSYWLPPLAAALYLAALLSEEIAFPLPLLLLMLPERPTAYAMAWHLEALAVFFAARTVMLGHAVTSYGFAIDAGDVVPLALLTPWRVFRSLLGPEPVVAAALGAVLIAVIVPALRSRRLAIAAGVMTVASLTLLFPMAKALELRHAVLVWLTVSIVFAMAARERWALVAAAMGLTLIANRGQWQIDFASSERQSREGRAFVALDAGQGLAYPAIPPAAMQELRWLKEIGLGGPPGADWFYDDIYLCEGHGGSRQFVSWRPETRAVEPIVPDPKCGQAKDAPMTLAFHHREEKLFWTFGPYRDGRWTVVMDTGRQSFVVPADDGFHLPGVRALPLQVRYDSPEGWRTYSPVMALDFAREPDRSFTR